jgi:two-component system OmpR family sensor kinase
VRSLRARLLGWLVGGVLFVGAGGGLIVYRNALAQADAFFDYHLRQTALLLRDQPVEYQLGAQLVPADDDFVVQVWSLNGVRVYLSRPHASLPQTTTLGFATVATREGRWRVFGVQAVSSVIQVAQPMSVREQRAVQLALQTLKPFALLLPGLLLLIWFAVGQALEPLRRLTALLKARQVDTLDPIPGTPLPDEVQPLVTALNELLARLRAAREHERAFMADAAHELRTPLTALQLQTAMLARASDEAERGAALGTLSAGVQRAIRLVEQLLSWRGGAAAGGGRAAGPPPRPAARAGTTGRARVRDRRGARAARGRRPHRPRRGGGAAGEDRGRSGRAADAAAQSHRQRGALHACGRARGRDGRGSARG